MSSHSPEEVTGLLRAWSGGDESALDKLTPLVYAELRRLARRYMGSERKDHTFQPTDLVNEAFLRMIGPALTAIDPRKAVELRFFGGLTAEETAAILNVSPDTVLRDWRLAKVWLLREIKRGSAH
jgi:DNA-directed RNA polymerase specialized sigma24 family protein